MGCWRVKNSGATMNQKGRRRFIMPLVHNAINDAKRGRGRPISAHLSIHEIDPISSSAYFPTWFLLGTWHRSNRIESKSKRWNESAQIAIHPWANSDENVCGVLKGEPPYPTPPLRLAGRWRLLNWFGSRIIHWRWRLRRREKTPFLSSLLFSNI